MRNYPLHVVAAALAVTMGLPLDGQAHTLFEDDELTLNLSGVGGAAGRLNINEDGDDSVDGQYQLSFARLVGSAVYAERGSFFLQLGARTGQVALLDARVSLVPLDGLQVQLGRFKMPASAEFLTSAGDLLFSRRAALSAVVAKRSLGGQLVYEPMRSDSVDVMLNAGLFTPGVLPGDDPQVGVGVGRVLVNFAERYAIHAAFVEQLLGDNVDSATDARVFAHNRQIDVAFSVRDERWRGLIEGVYVLDGPGDSEPVGVHVNAARKFPSGDVGVSEDEALGSVRLSLGRGTTDGDVERAAQALSEAWRRS
jgi:hypothetical protein